MQNRGITLRLRGNFCTYSLCSGRFFCTIISSCWLVHNSRQENPPQQREWLQKFPPSDPRSLVLLSWNIKGTAESTLDKDSVVRLMHHDPSDRGRLILIRITPRECTMWMSQQSTFNIWSAMAATSERWWMVKLALTGSLGSFGPADIWLISWPKQSWQGCKRASITRTGITVLVNTKRFELNVRRRMTQGISLAKSFSPC